MEVTDAEFYRKDLESAIARHAERHVELIIVEDIESWAGTRIGDAKGNPPAMAITDDKSGAWAILLRRSIDANWVASVISRIEYGGLWQIRSILTSPELFLRHTVLHELAHLANGWGQDREDDCDGWALSKLYAGAA